MEEAYDNYGQMRSSLACLECRRKKTRCNMRLPVCGLCSRVGAVCTYPTKRKTPEPRKTTDKENSVAYKKRFNHLMSVLEGRVETAEELDDIIQASEAAGKRTRDVSNSSDGDPDEDARSGESKRASFHESRTSAASSSTAYRSERSITSKSCSIDLPTEVGTELVEIFFSRIQIWLPLLHRPRFYAQFMDPRTGALKTGGKYSVEEALILNGIFALSARFSTHPYFASIPIRERGIPFGDRARGLHDRLRVISDEATLQSLQGCILLAYSFMVEGPSHRSWILSGVCIRLIYELDIDKVDERGDAIDNAQEWSRKEELRRAWWLVWELDTFGSIISQRPFNVNRKRMHVHLPVTDAVWWSDTPLKSTTLAVRAADAWANLRGCPNQNERCWSIVSNYLMSLILEKHENKDYISAEERQELQAVMYSFATTLPPSMQMNPDATYFDLSTMTSSNWVVLIHLDIATAKAAIPLLDPVERRKWLAGMPTAAGATISLIREREISRIISKCSPDFIRTCHPFLACIMIPVPLRRLGPKSTELEECMNREMFSLMLSQYAEIWGIGAKLLHLTKVIEKGEPLSDEDMNTARRFAVFFQRDPLFRHEVGKPMLKASNMPGTSTSVAEQPSSMGYVHPSYDYTMPSASNMQEYMASPSIDQEPPALNWSMRYRYSSDMHDSSPG